MAGEAVAGREVAALLGGVEVLEEGPLVRVRRALGVGAGLRGDPRRLVVLRGIRDGGDLSGELGRLVVGVALGLVLGELVAQVVDLRVEGVLRATGGEDGGGLGVGGLATTVGQARLAYLGNGLLVGLAD